jgi:hypothetical protein
MEVDRLVRNVVRELSPDDAHRDGAVRQIGDGARNPRHLPGVWHFELRESGQPCEQDQSYSEGQQLHWRDEPQFLQKRASASLAVLQRAH